MRRRVFVVSDLHVGGRPPDGEDPGFRMCSRAPDLAAFIGQIAARDTPSELVINGDFVDFLAEPDPETGAWAPLHTDPDRALRVLNTLFERAPDVFDALGALLGRGHRLTILLGNHDIELSYPALRAALETRIGATGRDYRFLYDGEAYVVGDALIEHGNRYDAFNKVDHGALRVARSYMSRREPIPDRDLPPAPPGSHIVAELMNPVKARYRFIDLLKPEKETAIPILVALEPASRAQLTTIARRLAQSRTHTGWLGRRRTGEIASHGGMGGFGGDMLGGGAPGASPGSELDDPLDQLLAAALPPGDLESFLARTSAATGDIASSRIGGVWDLLVGKRWTELDERMPALLAAVRAVQNTRCFDIGVETDPDTLAAAQSLAARGFRYVVFGHTHLAKDVGLDDGARYLNSGTWADLLRFPTDILDGTDEEAMARLKALVLDLSVGDFVADAQPTWAELEVDGDRVVEAAVRSL